MLSDAERAQGAPSMAASSTPPILRIPLEVTAQIFTHCLPGSPSPPDVDTAPLLLNRICTDWRNIALDTPELWAALQITRYDIPIEIIETWLSRAQSFPLSLTLKYVEPGSDSDSDDSWDNYDRPNSIESKAQIAQIIDVMQGHSEMWQDVELTLPLEQFQLLKPDLHLPMLERLYIHVNDYANVLPVDHSLHAFRSAPALRHLDLANGFLPTNLPLSWAQLTFFECMSGGLTADKFLTLLQSTPNIVQCAVTFYDKTDNPLPDVPPCAFLTSLSLCSAIPQGMDILEHISTPALQVLDLRDILFSGRELLPPLHRFLSRPECRLRELALRIDGDTPREADFIRLLEMQPLLEKFELCEGALNLHIALCRRLGNGTPFLPRLISLATSPHIYPVEQITAEFPVMLDTLVLALSTRWAAPTEDFRQIQECTLSWSGERNQELDRIVSSFRSRQDELKVLGINISVGN